ncbi:uncharacterized protein L201_004992 [Kwoniella dendrophila CBS 6074]|uniref:Inhibitor of growth protein N-terminal histone-binding domain-containing protein n=1 Tax=Kwoniella dendrophila CBS 6074 TaxID=1295534 RepID=A0AAX4JXY2_9TREE
MENFMKRYKDPLFAGLDDLFRTPPPDSPIQNTYQTASDPPPPPPPHPKEATLTKSPISIISISAESSNQENPKMSSPILDYQEDDSLYKLIIVTMEDIVRLQEELIDSNSTRHQECIDRIKSRLEEMNKVIEAINKTKEERKNNLKSYIDNCIKIALQEFISSSNLDQDNKNAKQKGKSEGSERGSSKSSSSTRSNENLKSNRGLRELKSLGQDFFSAERAKDKEDAKSISTNSKQREEYENPSLKLANRGTTNDLPGNRHNTNSTNNSAFISTGASNGPHTMTVSKASTQRKPGLKSSDIIDLTFSSDEEEDSLNSISSNSPKSKANLSIYSPAVKSDTKDRSSGNLEAGPSQRPLNPPMKVTPCSLKNLEERPIYAGKERNLKRSHTTFIQSERNPQSSQSSQIFNYKRWSETAKSKISGTIIGYVPFQIWTMD